MKLTLDQFRQTVAEALGERITMLDTDTLYYRLAERLGWVGKKVAGAQEFLQHYCDEWKAKYGAFPVIDGRAAGAAKTLVQDIGIEKAKFLVSAYINMADSWFVQNGHDLMTFKQRLNTIQARLHGHGAVTRIGAIQGERAAESDAQLARIKAGEV